MTSAAKTSQPPANLTRGKIRDILWDSAVEAFVQAWLILLMGGIALDIVGGLFHDMIPSAPPGLTGQPGLEAETSSAWHWQSPFKEHRFAIVFALLFILQAARGLCGRSDLQGQSKTASRLQKIGRRLSEDWFSLIVVNAFGALVGATVLAWTQEFSFTKMLWGWFLESVLPGLHHLAEQILGASRADAIGRWFSWYGDNQLKLDFWLIYLASVCDDLGIPNLKTLARFIWRRLRNRNRATPPAPVSRQPV
jgi:hypothetical protein